MSTFINYIIESTISLSLFYIFYEIFLKRDTWFRFNRYYLLFGVIFSLILPLLDFSAPEFMVSSQNQFEFNDITRIGTSVSSFEESSLNQIKEVNYLAWIYLLISSLFFVRFLSQLFKIFKTIYAYEIKKIKNYKIVFVSKDSAPFSFFHYIFISKEDYEAIGHDELLRHELVHAKQNHSFDIILLELLLVIQWFNPFMYGYRRAFKELHEYLADQGVLKENKDKIVYQKLILHQLEKSLKVNLASHFNYSLTKKRIKMMTRINSSNMAKLKLVFIVPFIIVLISAFSTEKAQVTVMNKLQVQSSEKKSTKIPSIFPLKRVEGVEISSGYGMRMHPIKKVEMMHEAVDIKAPEGTPVYATADGVVRLVQQNFTNGKGYGKVIIIDHAEGYSTFYSQLSDYQVDEKQEVKQGDVIGNVGSTGLSTGPHLHYAVMKNGENVNPEDYF